MMAPTASESLRTAEAQYARLAFDVMDAVLARRPDAAQVATKHAAALLARAHLAALRAFYDVAPVGNRELAERCTTRALALLSGEADVTDEEVMAA